MTSDTDLTENLSAQIPDTTHLRLEAAGPGSRLPAVSIFPASGQTPGSGCPLQIHGSHKIGAHRPCPAHRWQLLLDPAHGLAGIVSD